MKARLTDLDAAASAKLLVLAWVILFVVTAGPLVTSFLVTPEDLETGRVVLTGPCAIKQATGHDCMSCGLSRGFAALAHGRLGDSRRYHAGTPLVFAAFVGMAIWSARLTLRDARRAGWLREPLVPGGTARS